MITFLLILLGISFVINMGMFLIAYLQQTDKLTDISYALTFVVLVLVSAMAASEITTPKLVIGALTIVWAERLGTYLLVRVRTFGRDKRFDDVRNDFWKFARFWLGQALTVWIILLPTMLAIRATHKPSALWLTLGAVIWAMGFIIEGVADIQKFRFIIDVKNKGKWIDRGLWHVARHPNYFGEISVWTGVYIACVSALSLPAALIALVSPLFIACLLLFVSGVPPLEKSADKKWGKNPAYKAYKARTRLLVPLPRR
jgi:steroid 5-alpha reductase family enzyme